MDGWIKLHRELLLHDLWKYKPFSKGQAWIDLLMLANHKNNKFFLGNEVIEVERGCFITSEVKLSERWGWSRKKVRGFVSVLEREGMLTKKATTKYTALTIEKYGFYQGEGTAKEQQKNSKRTAKEQQKNTNKNVKNVKNEKNNNIYVSVFEFYLSLDLIKHKNFTESMKKAIAKAMKENKYSFEDCKVLLERHKRVVEKTRNNDYPVRVRGINEFFGQKVKDSVHLICSEYEEGGAKYEKYLKNQEQKKTEQKKDDFKIVIYKDYEEAFKSKFS